MSSVNPNDTIGGGGCACGETKPADQHGPFAIFQAVETDCGLSPFLVVCAPCAGAIVKQSTGELLHSGEDVLDVTAEDADGEQIEL